MKTTSYVALALGCFATSSLSAPTPSLKDGLKDITGILGSITNPSAGNGSGNGNANSAGNGNGDGNGVGNGNQAGNWNTINLGLRERGLKETLAGILDPITNPSAGNGNGNGNGNSAGNNNGNGNSAGNGNQAGNGNSINVGDLTLPGVTLSNIELPDIELSPTINLA